MAGIRASEREVFSTRVNTLVEFATDLTEASGLVEQTSDDSMSPKVCLCG